jgi:hypothetical protein
MIYKKYILCFIFLAVVFLAFYIWVNSKWYHWKEVNSFKNDPKTYIELNNNSNDEGGVEKILFHLGELVRKGEIEYKEFHFAKVASSSEEILQNIKKKVPNLVWIQVFDIGKKNQTFYLCKVWAKHADMEKIRGIWLSNKNSSMSIETNESNN